MRGRWVLCGHGRFGKVMVSTLEEMGIPVTIIDQAPPVEGHERWVRGDSAGALALLAADIQQAVGVSPAPTTTSTTCRSWSRRGN